MLAHSHTSGIMTNSYHDANSDDNRLLANIVNSKNNIMTQSLDSALNLTNANIDTPEAEKTKHTEQAHPNQNALNLNNHDLTNGNILFT